MVEVLLRRVILGQTSAEPIFTEQALQFVVLIFLFLIGNHVEILVESSFGYIVLNDYQYHYQQHYHKFSACGIMLGIFYSLIFTNSIINIRIRIVILFVRSFLSWFVCLFVCIHSLIDSFIWARSKAPVIILCFSLAIWTSVGSKTQVGVRQRQVFLFYYISS